LRRAVQRPTDMWMWIGWNTTGNKKGKTFEV